MNRFLKLVSFEFNRFWKLFVVLMGVTVLSQIMGVIVESRKYISQSNQMIYKELMSKNEYLEQFGTQSFSSVAETLWFIAPIGLCLVVLLIYVFFIWYRDWLGKNTFTYRLLMLPTARLHVYLAKAATILLYTVGLVALQLVLFPIENRILKMMVPQEFRTDLSVYEIIKIPNFQILFPNTFTEFVLYYGGGITAVMIVFTAILFERSYRLKGVFYGLLYSAASVFIFLLPLLVNTFILNNYFYPLEVFLMELGTGILVLAGAIWTGNFLIQKKVRV